MLAATRHTAVGSTAFWTLVFGRCIFFDNFADAATLGLRWRWRLAFSFSFVSVRIVVVVVVVL